MIRKIKSFFGRIYIALTYIPIVSFKKSQLKDIADGNWYEIRYLIKVDSKTKNILVKSATIFKIEQEDDLEYGANCKDCRCKQS